MIICVFEGTKTTYDINTADLGDSDIYDYLKNADLGSIVKFHVKGKTFDHFMIVVARTSDKITFYQANWAGGDIVQFLKFSYSDIRSNFDVINYIINK